MPPYFYIFCHSTFPLCYKAAANFTCESLPSQGIITYSPIKSMPILDSLPPARSHVACNITRTARRPGSSQNSASRRFPGCAVARNTASMLCAGGGSESAAVRRPRCAFFIKTTVSSNGKQQQPSSTKSQPYAWNHA